MTAEVQLEDLDACWLPDSLRALAARIGIGPASRLVKAHGGLDLRIPVAADPDHPLTALLGMAAMQTLVRHHGGGYIYIPRAAAALRCLRDREIQRRYDAGEKTNDLAREYALSARAVWDILTRPLPDTRKPDDRQLSLTF